MKFLKHLLAIGSALLCFSTAFASNNGTTFIGPTLRTGFTGLFADMAAYSIAGEAGPKNFRVGTTLGFKLDCNQRFKVTGEYLRQNIDFNFFSGNTNQWVQQGAVGARYEYDFLDVMSSPQFDISAYYSRAKSKNLNSISETTVTTGIINSTFFRTIETVTNDRRIAGSDAAGVSPGVSLVFWPGGRVGVEANYDHVKYHRHYESQTESNGWGVTFYLKQLFMENILIGASIAERKPFNNFEGSVGFTNLDWYGNWTLGLFGNYLQGKNNLPSTWNIGVGVDYSVEPCVIPRPVNYKGDFKHEAPPQAPAPDYFLAWVADPAVHMPQVLAIPDERVVVETTTTLINLCSPVIAVGTIPNQLVPILGGGAITPIDAALVFTGTTPFNFGINAVPSSPFITNTLTIDPVTGIISGSVFNTDQIFHFLTVTVTASNSCGSATTAFIIAVPPELE